MINLASANIEKNHQYEVIITTESKDGRNAAPFGLICTGEKSVMCRIFKGSKTLENILETKQFTVNIIKDPLAYSYATINTINEKYLESDNSIKGADSYFKCEVTDLKRTVKSNDPVNKSIAYIIKAEVKELIIAKENPQPVNRGMDLVIESIYNYQKFEDNPEYYSSRIREANRVVKKVGSKKEKQAIKLIREKLKEKGFNV